MKRRNKDSGAEEGGDGWLVSYADMMTLIACFFILMMAFANYDPAGFNKKAKELAKAFNKGKFKPSEAKLKEVQEEIARHPELKKKAKISVINSELVVSFSSSILFEETNFELSEKILPSLDTLIDIIRTKDPSYKVIIEGHTDSFEHTKIPQVGSTWELGALRASKVLARFEYYGFNPKKLVALTKGDTVPLADNVDDDGNPILENLQMNRRVIIKVVEPKIANQKIKFGFGVYFNE